MKLYKKEFPSELQEIIGAREYEIDDIGMSDSRVCCFDDMVLKIEKAGENAENEHRMMAWLSDKLPVPRIICAAKENQVNYLLMTKMPGEMSCDDRYLSNPRELTMILAAGLKRLWEVDIAGCPYNNMLDNKLRKAEIAVREGLCDTENVEPDTYGPEGFASPEELLQWLKVNRPEEDPVFSHGDFCLPNIFIKDGQVSGYIDLGNCGIADRYQDIALCYRSLLHNFNGKYGGKVYEGFEPEMLFRELGMEPDWEKIRYYILLDELF